MIAAARGTSTATIIREFVADFISRADREAEHDWALTAVRSYEARGKSSHQLERSQSRVEPLSGWRVETTIVFDKAMVKLEQTD